MVANDTDHESCAPLLQPRPERRVVPAPVLVELDHLLSRELGIPYIVEYNGSEISMNRSFGGPTLAHSDIFNAAEEAAFRQATMINVISTVVKDSLVQRGIDESKILVNPNGAGRCRAWHCRNDPMDFG